MRAYHVFRAAGHCGDLVDVEGGGVGRQDRTLLHDLVEFAENLALQIHVLKHSLDDHVDLAEVFHIGRAVEPGHPRLNLILREAAFVG